MTGEDPVPVVSENEAPLHETLGSEWRGRRQKEECAGNWLRRERRGRLGNGVKCLRGVVERQKEVIALT